MVSAWLSRTVAFALALGVLPSLTALSLRTPWPLSSMGPINPLKLALPLLIANLWIHRRAFPKILSLGFALTLGVGTACTLVAATLDRYPPTVFREWAAIATGLIAGANLLTMPQGRLRGIVGFWLAAIYGAAVLDAFFPSATHWLISHLFDPNSFEFDVQEVGTRPLLSIFGRQSLSKMLAWTPWLILLLLARLGLEGRQKSRLAAWAVFAAISHAMILATSQRGPLVGALVGWLAVAAHGLIQRDQKRASLVPLVGLAGMIVLTFLLVPRDVLEPRIRSLLGMPATSPAGVIADKNRDFRMKMSRFSFEQSIAHPWGHPGIQPEEFAAAGLPPAHSHSLVLHQYRERGWIWGSLHLILWLIAFWGGWKSRDWMGAGIIGGVTTIFVLGLVDHPWFVLNHAMMMAPFLLVGAWRYLDIAGVGNASDKGRGFK